MKKNQGRESREEVETQILKLAFEQKELSFTQIEKALDKYCTNTVCKYLKSLITRKFIGEKGARIDGKYRHRYFITPKGRHEFLRLDTTVLEEVVATIGKAVNYLDPGEVMVVLAPLKKAYETIQGQIRFIEDVYKALPPRERKLVDSSEWHKTEEEKGKER